jgi:hypothetical protein
MLQYTGLSQHRRRGGGGAGSAAGSGCGRCGSWHWGPAGGCCTGGRPSACPAGAVHPPSLRAARFCECEGCCAVLCCAVLCCALPLRPDGLAHTFSPFSSSAATKRRGPETKAHDTTHALTTRTAQRLLLRGLAGCNLQRRGAGWTDVRVVTKKSKIGIGWGMQKEIATAKSKRGRDVHQGARNKTAHEAGKH